MSGEKPIYKIKTVRNTKKKSEGQKLDEAKTYGSKKVPEIKKKFSELRDAIQKIAKLNFRLTKAYTSKTKAAMAARAALPPGGELGLRVRSNGRDYPTVFTASVIRDLAYKVAADAKSAEGYAVYAKKRPRFKLVDGVMVPIPRKTESFGLVLVGTNDVKAQAAGYISPAQNPLVQYIKSADFAPVAAQIPAEWAVLIKWLDQGLSRRDILASLFRIAIAINYQTTGKGRDGQLLTDGSEFTPTPAMQDFLNKAGVYKSVTNGNSKPLKQANDTKTTIAQSIAAGGRKVKGQPVRAPIDASRGTYRLTDIATFVALNTYDSNALKQAFPKGDATRTQADAELSRVKDVIAGKQNGLEKLAKTARNSRDEYVALAKQKRAAAAAKAADKKAQSKRAAALPVPSSF